MDAGGRICKIFGNALQQETKLKNPYKEERITNGRKIEKFLLVALDSQQDVN